MSKPAAAAPPAPFVNLQPSSVTVYDERRRTVTVCPWNDRNTRRDPGATFVVYGDHYKQFVSGAGPLYPFPGDPRLLLLPGKEQGFGVDTVIPAPKSQARVPAADDTVIPTTAGDARSRILAMIREELRQVGIASPTSLLQASSAQLFQCPHINAGNIKFVREAAQEMFPSKPAPATPPDPTVADDAAGDAAGEGEDAPAADAVKYTRAAIAAMGRNELLKTISAEGFEIPVTLKTEALREKLLQGLAEYGQLTE